jgi:hypothetical protein
MTLWTKGAKRLIYAQYSRLRPVVVSWVTTEVSAEYTASIFRVEWIEPSWVVMVVVYLRVLSVSSTLQCLWQMNEYKYEGLVEWWVTRITARQNVPVSLCPQQILESCRLRSDCLNEGGHAGCEWHLEHTACQSDHGCRHQTADQCDFRG